MDFARRSTSAVLGGLWPLRSSLQVPFYVSCKSFPHAANHQVALILMAQMHHFSGNASRYYHYRGEIGRAHV